MNSLVGSDEAAPAPRSGGRLNLRAEDGFARVVEASPNALVLVGQSGQIEMVNRQTERSCLDMTARLEGGLLDRWSTKSLPRLG